MAHPENRQLLLSPVQVKLIITVLLIGISLSTPVAAFTLDVRGTHAYFNKSREARIYIPFLDGYEPIHELLTDKALECGKAGSICEQLEAISIHAADIREGVRSNDFPAQYLDSNAVFWCKGRVLRITNDRDVPCILGSLIRASMNSEMFKNRSWAYGRPFGMRGHFGDLQFLHAMAPQGQEAQATYDGIVMWMEFAYRASRDEFDLRSDAHAVPVKGISKYFIRGSRRVGDLFNYRFRKSQVRGVALGQMLHIAQDSFAGCHAERNNNGDIERFLSYGQQSLSKHSEYDSDPQKLTAAISGALNPIAFGKELFALRIENRPWEEVEPLIRRYFSPVSPRARAIPGSHCQ